MGNIKFEVASELEFNRIIDFLKKSEIPYTFKILKDSSFPVLDKSSIYAEITISEFYKEKIGTLLNQTSEIKISKESITDKNKPRFINRFWIIILIGYSLITTLFTIKYWLSHRRDEGDKNFIYEWNTDNTEFLLLHKQTGKIIQRNIDRNYDLNFERSDAYSKNGFLIAQYLDLNEDGFPEEIQFYNQDGIITGGNFDQNFDGVFEFLIMKLENGDTLKLIDENQNGLYEMLR